jgi:hypothetical protein
MSEIHRNIGDALACKGLNIVSGDTGAALIDFPNRVMTLCGVIAYPEGDNSSRSIREYFEGIRDTIPDVPIFIITRSLFVMREAHMLQKQRNYPVRWFYLKADGSYHQADSMDEIGECEALDEEVMQAERYINIENGLKLK